MSRATIIIFGAAVRPDGSPSGAMRDRVEAAVRFAARLDGMDGDRGLGARFMPTGGVGRFGRAEAEVMAELLRARGVAPERIVPEATGPNTISSVRACARLLRGQTGRVYAATSAYHLPRCVVLLLLAGLDARPCPPPRGRASSSLAKRWYWRLREVPALPVDSALMVWLRLRRAV